MKGFLKSLNKKSLIIVTVVPGIIGLLVAGTMEFFFSLIGGIDGGFGYKKFTIFWEIIKYFLSAFLSIFIPVFIIMYYKYKSKEKKNNKNIENN